MLEFRKNLNVYLQDTKVAMAEAIKKSGLSRFQIADRMNEIIVPDGDEGPITKEQIDSWTKKEESRTSFFRYLPIFCHVTQNYSPLQAYASALSLKIIEEREMSILELGQAELRRIETARIRKVALSKLGILDEGDR